MVRLIAFAIVLTAGAARADGPRIVEGANPYIEASSASQRSESVRPAPNGSAEPVETPLVATVLPKKPSPPRGTEHIVGDKPFFVARNGLYIDGTKTKDGHFRYDASRNIFAPVDLGNQRYTHNGGRVGLEHLIAEHGHARSSASKWTQEELEIAHANSHEWEKRHASTRPANVSPKVVYSTTSGCPGGNCPSPSVGRGLFGRRR